MVVTWGEVRLDITICSAILMRIVLIGSMRVLACPAGGSGAIAGVAAGGAAGGAAWPAAWGAGAAGAAGGGGGAAAAGCDCAAAKDSTSCLVMRPPAPV